MARIRSIKPEFFTSEQVVECSPTARLLFVGMWCFCDDHGIHPASVKTLKMEVFPGDAITDDQVLALIGELKSAGLLTEYVVDSKHYWQVTGWKHQKIDKPTYRHPLPEGSPTIRRPLADPSATESSRVEGRGVEPKGAEERAASRYAFEGGVIKLTPSDFQQIKTAYHAIPDLRAELTVIDAKFRDKPPANWFQTLGAWLNRDHQRRLAEQKAKQPAPKANVKTL